MPGTNEQPYDKSFTWKGIARTDRFTPALDPANIRIEDRKLEDFMAYLLRYTSKVLYYDKEEAGKPSHTWDEMYRTEPAFLMARIATKDLAEIKNTYDRLLTVFEKNRSVESFQKLVEFVFSRFKKIDNWFASVTDHPLEEELALQIRSHLVSGMQKLQDIIRYQYNLHGQKEEDDDAYTLENKDNIWELKTTGSPPMSLAHKTFAGSSEQEKLVNASIVVNAVFESVFYSTRSIVTYCREYFQSGIYKVQQHPPHIALFMTFIRLMGYQHNELNQLPAKHLDYYYREVLQIQPRAAIPDQTFVHFELAGGFEEFQVPKGSLLTAGKDQTKKELFYRTDRELVVNKACVETIHSLQVAKAAGKVSRFITSQIKRNREILPTEDGMAGSLHPLFNTDGAAATIGFAIASTQFYLAKGERVVTIEFVLKDALPREVYDTDLFALRFTAEKAWIDSSRPLDFIEILSLKRTERKNKEAGKLDIMELRFSISIAQASSVVPFSPAVHEGNFDTIMPVMQFLLLFAAAGIKDTNKEDRIQQLNEIMAVCIRAVYITVEAGDVSARLSFDGVRNLELENHESELDVSKPFFPFTAIPKVGSSFYIGCSDLQYKEIQKFSLNIEWMLPDNFHSYYNKYFPPYDAGKFSATLSILKKKKWSKLQNVTLIDNDEFNGRFRSIRIDLEKHLSAKLPDTDDKEITRFNTGKKDGTLRMKLLYPDFGHSIYPQLITSAVLERSTSRSATVDYYKIVKKQLYDAVISIKLPDDADKRNGSFKVVIYEVMEKIRDDARARSMMVNGLTEKIKEINGTDAIALQLQEAASAAAEPEAADRTATVVNDDGFIARVLNFLKRITWLDRNIHFDKDEQDVQDVAGMLKDSMNTSASAILPSHWELGQLIMNEINSAIHQIVYRIVEDLLKMRKTAMPDGTAVRVICKKYIDEANEVINDMIARKIAILLAANDIPPKPYTPVINNIALNYVSNKQLVNMRDQFFHITPFGVLETAPLSFSGKTRQVGGKVLSTDRLFPLTATSVNELTIADEGQLYIGLSGATPFSTVSLFFHLEEGIRKTDLQPPGLRFWYLCHSQWRPLSDDWIISDGTYGLQTTGIIEISLPGDLTGDPGIFDNSGLSWLCISVKNNTGNFPLLANVNAQAVPVSFVNNQNDPAHFETPLAAWSIKAFADDMPGIKKIMQPVPSFPGKMAEAPRQYYTRISERIRHKQRAITPWDYEHLLLEEFPFLYKLNCINNYCKDRFLPGHVTVVPIVYQRHKQEAGSDFHPPMATYYELRKMEACLAAHTSPFVKVHAVNPSIYYIKVRCKVRMHANRNRGYYLNLLLQELTEFLTPWMAIDSRETISFSSKIYLSSIISFIDGREYIDFVTDIEMNQYTGDNEGNKIYNKASNGTLALFETAQLPPHAILASAPDHVIEII